MHNLTSNSKFFIHYAGPIPYTLQSSSTFIYEFRYKKTRNNKTFYEVVYLKSLEHREQLLAIYNGYSKQSGSNWEYVAE